MLSLPRTAFVLSQGEELLEGLTVDTNAHFLCGELSRLGFRVLGATTAGDSVEAIADGVQRATECAQVVVCTGGLGPTGDDHTAAAVAQVAESSLVLSEEALAQIEERYLRLGRRMAPSNRKQALLPPEASLIPNPNGTAPGFAVSLGQARLFCLPGVPSEMKPMWSDWVVHRLEETFSVAHGDRRHVFRCIGRGESQLQDLISPVAAAFQEVELGFRAKLPEVEVKLRAARTCEGFEGAVGAVRRALGSDCFSENRQRSLAAVVGELLVARGEQIALAESCTGGLIGHLCVSEPGSSRWLERGYVTYSNESKVACLGVEARLIAQHGAVSEEVAVAMARGARSEAGVPWGVAVTGVAGPTGGSKDKPVGTVCVAVDGPSGKRVKTLHLGRDRQANRTFGAWIALDMLRRQILRLR